MGSLVCRLVRLAATAISVTWRWGVVLAGLIAGIVLPWWRRRPPEAKRLILKRGLLALVATGIALVAYDWSHVPGHWWEATSGKRPLYNAKSWYYHIGGTKLERVLANDADLVVIDFAHDEGDRPFAKEEVERMRQRPGKGRRLVVSYMSIGEGESYRFYWNKEWEKDEPGWFVVENCAWPRNYKIRFWHDGWKDIMYRGKKSYLKRIIDAGFDGVYLDRIDIFHNLYDERPTVREDMIEFVRELATRARAMKPGFLIIAQNAEDLLPDRDYRSIIDGLGKEDLLYGVHGTEKRNPAKEVNESVRQIRHLQWDWKPIFAVEYLAQPKMIESARAELKRLGLISTFAHRGLDGLDPTLPRPPGTAIEYGTKEWTDKNCKDKPHW